MRLTSWRPRQTVLGEKGRVSQSSVTPSSMTKSTGFGGFFCFVFGFGFFFFNLWLINHWEKYLSCFSLHSRSLKRHQCVPVRKGRQMWIPPVPPSVARSRRGAAFPRKLCRLSDGHNLTAFSHPKQAKIVLLLYGPVCWSLKKWRERLLKILKAFYYTLLCLFC